VSAGRDEEIQGKNDLTDSADFTDGALETDGYFNPDFAGETGFSFLIFDNNKRIDFGSTPLPVRYHICP
jgi:hypothetical protein